MIEVMGRPVTGEVAQTGRTRHEQWPGDKFIELLDAVLTAPGVEAVKWHQYTPSFNDGDPCEFGVHEFYVRVAGTDEEAGDYEDGFLGGYDSELNDAVKTPLRNLGSAGGHCEDFLRESFGDHAQVTATAKGFEIEYYDHD
ncbi:MAG: hypothetical protein JWO67_4482 [Streptosporangiaceae bacterium]|nr:hypothetical protein [Streptosporangiaceae bacterium]